MKIKAYSLVVDPFKPRAGKIQIIERKFGKLNFLVFEMYLVHLFPLIFKMQIN